jgi:hypothetical protein
MKRTGILLTLLASMTLVLVVACGGRQPQNVVQVTPPAAPEPRVTAPPPQPVPPPQPMVTRESTVTREEVTRQGPGGSSVTTREVVVTQAPPPLRQEVITMAPSPTNVWVPGYWSWNNGWQWVAGHWEQPPQRMTTWVPGQWEPQGSNWVWRPGRWQ